MRILFLGAPIAPNVNPTISNEQRFAATGHNTGNLLIGQSLFEELSFTEYAYGQSLAPEKVDEKFDVIVIAAANFIFKKFDFAPMAEFVESTKLPCVMIGLGAQAPRVGEKVTDIPDGSKRLLKVVSDRSRVVGVRGHFTAEVMNDFGVQNVRAVGCPSLYRRLTRNLTLRRPGKTRPLRISLNGSRNVVEHSTSLEAARMVEAQLLTLSIKNGYEYVLQNENPEMHVLWSSEREVQYIPHLRSIVTKFGLGITANELLDHIRLKNRLFFDLEAWDRYISNFDYSLGSRFHGNLIALTNGVPATILTHDSRTTEMAELMSIPHVSVAELRHVNPEELLATADFDGFERKYQSLYDRFAEFLSENGLTHKLAEAQELVSTGEKARSKEPV